MEAKEWLNNNELAIDIWERKYQKHGESFDEWLDRVSNGNEEVRNLILKKKFLFGGRILSNRGITDSRVTYSNCFTAGTKVITKRGLVNIEDVKVGDEVITADDTWQKVNEVMSRDYEGDLYRIKSNTLYDDIVCTPNHKFLTQNGWKRADRLECMPMRVTKPDRLKIPKIRFEKSYEDVDLLDYMNLAENQFYEVDSDDKIQIVTNFKCAGKYGVSDKIGENRLQSAFNRYLHLDEDMRYFIGRWLGDGSVTLKSNEKGHRSESYVLQIVFNATKEQDAADRIIKIGTEHFGINPNIRVTEQNVIAVRWNSQTICNFFAQEFGRGCSNKKIPDKYIGDLQIALGLLDSDGYIGSHGDVKIVLKNEGMIDWLKDTLYLNGMNTNKKKSIEYRQKDSFELDISTSIGKGRIGKFLMKSYYDKAHGLDELSSYYKDYAGVQDISIEENISCKVYNLSVEGNHSYTANGVVVHNCYVISPPEDSIESIYESRKKLARTFSYGGGCGVDISNLAPVGARVQNQAEHTSGAVSFMEGYSKTTEEIGQNGRRGALMISLDCHHPDLIDFINVKTKEGSVTKANISVRVTNDFMEAVRDDKDWVMSFTRPETGETVTKTEKAREIFRQLCQNNADWAEPGLLFWDRIENWNLLNENPEFSYAGTNPCSAQCKA